MPPAQAWLELSDSQTPIWRSQCLPQGLFIDRANTNTAHRVTTKGDELLPGWPTLYLSELLIENFRMFGEGDRALLLPLRRGLTALVGENDSGKTAVIDALRLALGTRDQESFRIEETDFHQPRDGSPGSCEIRIRCKFEDLEPREAAAFIEFLTYENSGSTKVPILFVNWKAAKRQSSQRSFTAVEVKSGERGDGPWLDAEAKSFLSATYLRPLRDAQRAMSAGRGSRLSQILKHTREVRDQGQPYDPNIPVDPDKLSVLGIGDYANALLGKHPGVTEAQDRLNADYLDRLFFDGEATTWHGVCQRLPRRRGPTPSGLAREA